MSFTPEPTKTPDAIGNIVVTLKDAVATGGSNPEDAYQSANFQLVVEFNDGSTIRRAGNLVPHITPAERAARAD